MATGEIDLTRHFYDPDRKPGETLSYEQSSDDNAVATASVAGNTLTITAGAVGGATITVTAMDKDELTSPPKSFNVTVTATMAPIVAESVIPAQTLYLGDGAKDIVLTTSEGSEGGYFTHSNAITYEVSSLPVGVVAAVEANGTLTLTPLVMGQTIVTVVATADSKSSVPVKFTVTVEEGSKPEVPDEVPEVPDEVPDEVPEVPDRGGIPTDQTITGKNGTVPVEIAADSSLESQNTSVVTVGPKSDSKTTWILTGEMKGSTTILVYGADNEVSGTFLAKVKNTAPYRNNDPKMDGPSDPQTLLTLTETADRKYLRVDLGTTGLRYGDNPYFMDVDYDDLNVSVSSNSRFVIVKPGHDEHDDNTIVVDVVKNDMLTFTLTVTAKDEAGLSADKALVISVQSRDPIPMTYPDGAGVEQGETGDFASVIVEYRPGVLHTLQFETIDEANHGFRFAKLISEDVMKRSGSAAEEDEFTAASGLTDTVMDLYVPADSPADPPVGSHRYRVWVDSGSAIRFEEDDAGLQFGTDPQAPQASIKFITTGWGPAKVYFAYEIWVEPHDDDNDPFWLGDGEREMLTVTVSRVH